MWLLTHDLSIQVPGGRGLERLSVASIACWGEWKYHCSWRNTSYKNAKYIWYFMFVLIHGTVSVSTPNYFYYDIYSKNQGEIISMSLKYFRSKGYDTKWLLICSGDSILKMSIMFQWLGKCPSHSFMDRRKRRWIGICVLGVKIWFYLQCDFRFWG